LQTKEEEDATKEAFDGTAFAQFLFGPNGRQAGAVLRTAPLRQLDRQAAQGKQMQGLDQRQGIDMQG